MDSTNKPKVVHMVTTANSIGLMKGQLSYLDRKGFDVTVLSSPGEKLNSVVEEENVKTKGISMERTISPLKDLISLIRIIIYFLKVKPQICNSGTPKAGLLGMVAAWITRVPYKVYTIRGIPLEGSAGFKKKIFTLTEKIACACADKVICISPSLEEKTIELNLTSKSKTIVFGKGSSNGLQIDHYKKDHYIKNEIQEIQEEKNLNKYSFIIGYVGRINNYKGVEELVIAFESLQKSYDNICLLLLGRKEDKDAISNRINKKIKDNPDIFEMGQISNPIPYYYIMDILAFPTYREGFGNVSIEAQATGTPVITTNATGSVDTVINDETGFIVSIGTVVELERAIEEFINNPHLIEVMGLKGKERVKNNFDSKIIWEGLNSLYWSALMKDQEEV